MSETPTTARRNDEWSQQNLAQCWDASKDLDSAELRALDNFLIGWISGLVPPEQWAAGIRQWKSNTAAAR